MKASLRNFDREKKERVFLQDDKFMTSHYPKWVCDHHAHVEVGPPFASVATYSVVFFHTLRSACSATSLRVINRS